MKCLVLKEMPLGEADKLLTVLSEDEGRISVVAKGAKKPSSRFLAASSAFALSNMELVKGKSLYILRNANMIKSFYGLREDLDSLTAASRMAHAVLRVIQEGLPDPETLDLTEKALTLLEDGRRGREFVEAVFFIRLMSLQGVLGDVRHVLPDEGRGLRPGTLTAIDYICGAEEDRVFAFRVSEDTEKELFEVSSMLFKQLVE